ncbi:hypothetical protein NA57DRAFT_52730 [Rhizodiscina lignyota]|uniref:MYND-type domain-containing protein n=1 Tax=Rhizodiscina lignyota TaxID=1504668 RepID=A0A9P4IRJ7_9PEZI|nr:hypothetical protein NA57DRAFT_52730 [Rhizodiscina lignyota]
MADPDPLCANCPKPHSKICAGCRSIHYCSKKCQKADWPTHKLLCRSFATFDISTRPTEWHYRAILFPTDERTPHFIWVFGLWKILPGCQYQCYETAELLDGDCGASMYIQENTRLGRELKNCIQIEHRDAFLHDGSKPNLSIRSLTGFKQYYNWRGPIVVCGNLGAPTKEMCRDIDMLDVRHLVFEQVEIILSHPILHNHDVPDIPNRVEIPLWTWQYPPNEKWMNLPATNFGGKSPYSNSAASYLHTIYEIDVYDKSLINSSDPGPNEAHVNLKNNWFKAAGIKAPLGDWPLKWKRNVGSIMVMRGDMMELHPAHVKALVNYCFWKYSAFAPLSTGANDEDVKEKLSAEQVLSSISKASFEDFWKGAHWRDAGLQSESNGQWDIPGEENAVSPYDVKPSTEKPRFYPVDAPLPETVGNHDGRVLSSQITSLRHSFFSITIRSLNSSSTHRRSGTEELAVF